MPTENEARDPTTGLTGKQLPSGYSTSISELAAFKLPELTEEERHEMISGLKNEATEQFESSFQYLAESVKKFDPLELLATASFYYTLRFAWLFNDQNVEGPPQAMLELLHSICLWVPKDTLGKQHIPQQTLAEIASHSQKILLAFPLVRLPEKTDNEEHLLHDSFIEEARLHTQNIRNWAYPHHMRETISALFAPLEDDLTERFGMGPIVFMKLAGKIERQIQSQAIAFEESIQETLSPKSVRERIKRLGGTLGMTRKQANGLYESSVKGKTTLEESVPLVFFMSHSLLKKAYSFSVNECVEALEGQLDGESIKRFLDSIAYEFGALQETPREHLVAQSPIRTHPLIKLSEESYFLPVLGSFNSFCMEIFESKLATDKTLKKRYHNRRATYLEQCLEESVRSSFPSCEVYTGTVWTEGERRYENDCLLVAGPFVVIFEAKSEAIKDATRRGAQGTLLDQYQRLLKDPYTQGDRLAKQIEEGIGLRQFSTKNNVEFSLDLSQIRRVLVVGVTLDLIPSMSLSWKRLKDEGLLAEDSRPSMSITLSDLRIVFECLDSPAQRLHFLWRRIEWEKQVSYIGDELDLLVYYFSESMIPKYVENSNKPMHMNLYGHSDQLNKFYMSEAAGNFPLPPRPRRIMTIWWQEVLSRFEAKKSPHMWDTMAILLDLSYEQQTDFEQGFREVIRAVASGGNDSGKNAVRIHLEHKTESRGVIVGFAYDGITKENRDARAASLWDEVLAEDPSSRIVVIGRDIRFLRLPYSVLWYCKHQSTESNASQ